MILIIIHVELESDLDQVFLFSTAEKAAEWLRAAGAEERDIPLGEGDMGRDGSRAVGWKMLRPEIDPTPPNKDR
jgi:hypothetical protein